MEDKKLKIIGALILAIIVLGAAFAFTNTEKDSNSAEENREILPKPSNKTTIYFFWGDGCPVCAKEKPFIEELDQKHEDLEVRMYEVYYNETNQKLYQNMAKKYGFQARNVPGTFLAEEYWIGFSNSIRNEIEAKTTECLDKKCESPLK
ncbi:MAG: thioredoxin family protein [Candidatus Nanohaloarchaeota archaeon QJJ-9]|nr:thioredoxin family protein [Candidatus Nanohaloarchaeota archaeon QJJ-9]